MSSEVGDAWQSGFKGAKTTITFVDDFRSNDTFGGSFDGRFKVQQHGRWTSDETHLVAPMARLRGQDFVNTNAVSLVGSGLNIINLSYSVSAATGYTANQIGWSDRERSIIKFAMDGLAVVSKAAGNDSGVAVGKGTTSGSTDYLNVGLIGSKSVIFVGALDKNGTTTSQTSISKYSNIAGNNVDVQNRFLTVGVTGGNSTQYKLLGTSFAAPIVSGYAAILGSKFTGANATQISNQLLNTARTDTIANYSASVYGKGEASITRALAPMSIR